MNILEQIYEISFEKVNFLERKEAIFEENTILLGPPKCGKSYLIYDFLSKYDTSKYIYIDFDEYKNSDIDIIKNLDLFIEKNAIEVAVLENYKFNFDLPKVTNTIITTNINKTIENFTTLYLKPLDFEEFILFDTKHQNIANSFNSFLKYGNLPEIIDFVDTKKVKRNYEICKLYCENKIEYEILFLLIKSSGEKKSIFQLFNQLKKTTKISKDKFYEICDNFEFNNIVFFCKKYEQPKAVKKIFIFNHALMDIVSYNKNFTNLFTNMVFLELNKYQNEVFYLDNIDFYIPKENKIVLSIPFFNNIIIANITKKLLPIIEKQNIQELFIITVSSDQEIYIGDLEVQVMTFYNWVLSS
ncbi:MAG: ATP-binding protein [Campylobacterota bacterium]|nr:ATP-binding protein [Campylobacterota bacterium]